MSSTRISVDALKVESFETTAGDTALRADNVASCTGMLCSRCCVAPTCTCDATCTCNSPC